MNIPSSAPYQPSNRFNRTILWILFGLAVILWVYCFRGFLAGRFSLSSDALAYYEHFKFFSDQLIRGVYPLWDPDRQSGVPNEFFLRRIGSYNPLFLWLLILRKLGVSYVFSYFSFLTFYYFLGMFGFYSVSQKIFRNTLVSFAGFLILAFSSIFALLFNSFIILIFTPMVWFFFFLIAFVQNPQRFYALGITFCLMVLLSTYLPFYFFTVLMIFLLFFIFLYVDQLKIVFERIGKFVWANKGFTSFCLAVLLVSLIPGVRFYQEAKDANFVLPIRHMNSTEDNQFAVSKQTNVEGGVVATNFAVELFSNQKHFRLGFFYVPLFVHLLFLMGFFLKLNRRLVLLGLWALLTYLISVYSATPFYKFLYEHVFYFKYFRNFQFFLWLVLLPLYVLVACEHLRLWGEYFRQDKRSPWPLVFIAFIHIGAVVFLAFQIEVVWTAYGIVCLSLIFFLLLYFKKISGQFLSPGDLKESGFGLALILIFLTIVAHPVHMYSYLEVNVKAVAETDRNRYDEPYLNIRYVEDVELGRFESIRKSRQETESDKILVKKFSTIYMGTKWYNAIFENLNFKVWELYMKSKFWAYDRVEWVDENEDYLERMGRAFLNNENTVFVTKIKNKNPAFSLDDPSPSHAEIITQESKRVTILSYDINEMKLKTNFDSSKFFVYNDCYYPGWEVYVNGKKADLWRANMAFKGVHLPSGENIVHFRFGSRALYLSHWGMLALFYGVFACLALTGFKLFRREGLV